MKHTKLATVLAALGLVGSLIGGSALATQASAAPIKVASAPVAPSWINSATIYEVNTRQFSEAGTFNAVTDALPRIHALGTDAVWLMPIFPISTTGSKGTLGSPYAVSDYTDVNPNYGTKADFKKLVDTAHSLGMKIILDWVPNHTGWDNAWIKTHPDWYTHDAQGNITYPPGTDWTDVADLNYDSAGLRTAMTDALKYWVTNFDIDGYRQDVAGGVPTDFWNSATAEVNAIKPLFWLAENQDEPALLSQAFSANYNWELLGAFNTVGDRDKLMFAVQDTVSNYPKGRFPMNFITNHDENSWNGTEFDRLGNAVKESAAIAFTAPGVPLLYNGQEVGLTKQLQFFEKDPIVWDANPAASSWTAFYTKLTTLKKSNPALWAGTAGGSLNFISNNNSKTLSYARVLGSNKVILIANLSAKKITPKLSFGKLAGKYFDYATGKAVKLAKSQKLTVQPWSFVVYSSNKVN